MSMSQTGTTDTNESFGSDQLRLVSFNVGQECFAVDILSVQEINRMMELTQVPQSPPGVCGVINLRGRIVPVLDLRTRFGLEATEQNDASRIIVVEIQGSTVGFIVDEVHEVLRIDPGVVSPAPAITSGVDSTYIKGVAKLEDRLLILLDLNQLISKESLESIGAISASAA
jgi:purine-binding chemotaxis protein CheW